jgi:hypothetical protein
MTSMLRLPGHGDCLFPLNRLILPVPFLGRVVISSPCWSMIRRLVPPVSMITMFLAWLKPTWIRWRATWMPPLLDTFRWMTRLARLRFSAG